MSTIAFAAVPAFDVIQFSKYKEAIFHIIMDIFNRFVRNFMCGFHQTVDLQETEVAKAVVIRLLQEVKTILREAYLRTFTVLNIIHPTSDIAATSPTNF